MKDPKSLAVTSGFPSHKAFLNSFLYSSNGLFLSGAVLAFPFPCYISGLVWFGVILHCSFLPTDFLTEPRKSFYQKFSSLTVELGLFWPCNTFMEKFQLFPALFLFLMDNSVCRFPHLGNQHRFVLLVTLFCMSVFHMNRTKFPVSLKLWCLVCITLKSEKLTCFGCSVLYWETYSFKSQKGVFSSCLNSLGSGSQVKIPCSGFSFCTLKVLEIAFPGPWFDPLSSDVCYPSPSWNLLPSIGVYLRLYHSCITSYFRVIIACVCVVCCCSYGFYFCPGRN